MQLDYFNGRTVEAVADEDGGGWRIEFEDGSRIVNHDPDLGNPGAYIVGVSLNRVDLSNGTTVLNFGPKDNPLGTQINLNPTKYSIFDPVYTKGEEVFPQAGALTPPVEAEAPDERVAEGPSDKWKDDQVKILKDAEDDAKPKKATRGGK